jgi:hypothetical protein
MTRVHELSFTSPLGRGRRAAPGEGFSPNVRAYPLTPTLSPWERGCAAVAVTASIKQGFSEGWVR